VRARAGLPGKAQPVGVPDGVGVASEGVAEDVGVDVGPAVAPSSAVDRADGEGLRGRGPALAQG
jgi:hypothetical protein